jgi:hypothetical protein
LRARRTAVGKVVHEEVHELLKPDQAYEFYQDTQRDKVCPSTLVSEG